MTLIEMTHRRSSNAGALHEPLNTARGRRAFSVLLLIFAFSTCRSGWSGEEDGGLSGQLTMDYVPRWIHGTDTGDQDLYLTLLLDFGSSRDRVSGSVYWRGVQDLDGPSESISNRFHSVYDEFGDGTFSQLYYAYADVRSDGFLKRVRLGRQRIYQGLSLLFDGIRAQTAEGPRGLRASAFAGVPVHFFEDSSSEAWLAGVEIGMRPWRGADLSALLTHVSGRTDFLGLPDSEESSDLLVLNAGSLLGDWGQATVRHTIVDGASKDVLARLQVSLNRLDACAALSVFRQPSTLDEFSLDISPFTIVQGQSYPHTRIHLDVSKGFRLQSDWLLRLGGAWIARRLDDPADEGEYNREYDLARASIGVEAPGRRRFSASIGPVWWWSAGEAKGAVEAEARWHPREGLTLGVGTNYSYYQYDILTLSERTDVTDTYFKARWKMNERAQFSFRHAVETYDGETIHKMDVGCTIDM